MFGYFQIINFIVNIFEDKPLFQYYTFSKWEIFFWNRRWIYCSEITGIGHLDHFKTFSFPSPSQKHFSTGTPMQMENWSRFKRDVFFPDRPFYQKTQWGWSQWNGTVCFSGVLYETLSKMAHASSPLHPDSTRSPEDATCLPKARHVAQWQCCPTSPPHTVMLPWEALLPPHELKPESIYFNTNVTD